MIIFTPFNVIREGKMKVLFIEPCYENFGGYHRAIGIAKALSQNGTKVDMIVPSVKKFFLKIKKDKINNNLTIYTLPKLELHFWISGRVFRGLLACLFILFKKYDIIHAFAIVQFETNIPFLFATLLRKKVIIDWDDHWVGMDVFYPTKNGKKDKRFIYFNFCEYKIQKLAKFGTVTSEFLKNEFYKIGVKEVHQFINGINPDQYLPISREEARRKLNIPQDAKILLTFGNTFFAERTIYLFQVCEKLFELDPSINLYINLDPKKLIEELPERYQFHLNPKVLENIVNVGFLNSGTMPLYVGACNAILFTMGESTYEIACFPIRVGSFINGERTIITNDTPTEACRFLKSNGYAVAGKTIDDVVRQVIHFFKNKEKEKEIELKMQKTKLNYSWDQLAKDLIKFYERVIKS